MNRYEKLKRNTKLFTIGSLASSAITFLLLPMLTRKLTTTQYGEIDFINITITLLIPILSLNMVESILRFGVDKNYRNKEVFSTIIYIFVISFITIFFIAILILNLFNID
ncbi:polysaccharide biosynthesis protein, partial [Clostridium perfringens]|nr:polysaccharide biosynthesis protein [Clostridium perfringens]